MEITKESVDEIDSEIERESIRKIEAALFVSGRFMTLQELVALTDVNPIILRKILGDLGDKYKEGGIEIINKDNLWKMDVSQEYTWMVNKLATGSSEFSRAEQETLAIIAYKQPMKQSVLIKIRGNKGYEHVKKFVEMGLIVKKKMGHTAELTLSENFHEYFHVNFEGSAENGIGEEIKREIGDKEEMKNENKENIGTKEEIKEEEKEGVVEEVKGG